MEHTTFLSFCGLLVASSHLADHYGTSPALDCEFHATAFFLTAALVLLLAGSVVVFADRYRLLNLQVSSPQVRSYLPSPISSPLADQLKKWSPAHSRRSSAESNLNPASKWRKRAIVGLLAVCVAARVIVLRSGLRRTQCSTVNLEAFLPLVLSLYDLWRMREWLSTPLISIPAGPGESRRRESLPVKIWRWCRDSRYAQLASTACFGACATVVASASSGPRSTYLCAAGSAGVIRAVALQFASLGLDGASLVSISELIGMFPESRSRDAKPRAIGWAFVASSVLLGCHGAAQFLLRPNDRLWMVTLSPAYLFTTFKLGLAMAATCFLALQLALKSGVLASAILTVFSLTYASSWISASTMRLVWITSNESTVLLGLFTMIAALLFALDTLWVPRQNRFGSNAANRRWRVILLSVGILLLVARAYLSLGRLAVVPHHPIDSLIEDAGKMHEWSVKENSRIETLEMAVEDYKTRYGRHPPPNFHIWHWYAVTRKSVYLSDFDNIFHDILPFWSLSPQEVRRRTVEDIAQLDNGVCGIRIRDGVADYASDVPESHRWMMQGLIEMIDIFAHVLPDMDLAFNLNDESRVMVPFEHSDSMLQSAEHAFRAPMPSNVLKKFTKMDAQVKWPRMSNDSVSPYPTTQPFQPIFEKYGSAYCHPQSAARTTSAWDRQSLCIDCLRPHSHPHGPFPRGITYPADVCHQPDLAHLHGFYSSPSTFRGTLELRPTFSQSQAPGFRDIRYPNPWNYEDRDNTTYKPSHDHPDQAFADKENTLFWRGATTEGFAADDGRGAWQGMTRQRFVALANFPSEQSVLLPDGQLPELESSPAEAHSWSYHRLSPQQLRSYFSTNVSIRHPISRCIHHDCDAQVDFFNTTSISATPPSAPESPPGVLPPATTHTPLTEDATPFQAHWRYRFLFDTDGAAFSGRFIPFLRSRSLPVKTTPLFKEWWHGRVAPWWHYVPVDPRLTGLYSTLAYFAGLNGRAGVGPNWAGRPDQAEAIAERGREWADRVLRKEDMEIYLFRLLLEWGRVVDDNRDSLGYMPLE